MSVGTEDLNIMTEEDRQWERPEVEYEEDIAKRMCVRLSLTAVGKVNVNIGVTVSTPACMCVR